MLKHFIIATVLFLLSVLFSSHGQADWTNLGTINGVQVYRDNLTGLEWTTTLGRVPSSDWGSSARGLVARYGFRLPSFYELQQMQRHGGFSRLNIRSTIGNYYETNNSRYLANAAINGFQTPQERKGSGQNWVIGVRNGAAEDVIIVQETIQEQSVTVTPVQVEIASVTPTGNVTVTSVTSAQTEASSKSATINHVNVCVPNPVSVQIPPAPAGIVKSTLAAINESLKQKIELLRNMLSETNFSLETIVAKMKEKNVTVADQSAMITAFEEGDAAAVQRIWIVVTNDIKEAGQVSQTVKLLAALDSFGESIEEEDFSADDFKDFRKTLEKNKLDKETDKKIKSVLNSLALLVDVHKQLSNLRPSKTTQTAKNVTVKTVDTPDENVMLIIHPTQNPNDVFAIDDNTFIVGKKGELLEVVKGTLDDFVQKPIIVDETPITDSVTENQITLSNPAETTESVRFSLDNETKTLAAGESQSYPFPASGEVKIYTTKTRTVSSGRRRGTQTQTYQDSRNFSVTAGITYDFESDTENGKKIVPRPVKITFDNRNGTVPFHLNVDDQPVTIEPSESKTFNADNGFLKVQFARSEEPDDVVSINFYKSQTAKPAISKNDNKWALFLVP
ncbi:MAG: hypothetical protein LBP87_04960 [Planctomycetaceae bacterium]|jgi:hypothetical protein|nr:hypothetical protein [Planctomycetaceae bacterium]